MQKLSGEELPRKRFSAKDKGPKQQINIWWPALHYIQVLLLLFASPLNLTVLLRSPVLSAQPGGSCLCGVSCRWWACGSCLCMASWPSSSCSASCQWSSVSLPSWYCQPAVPGSGEKPGVLLPPLLAATGAQVCSTGRMLIGIMICCARCDALVVGCAEGPLVGCVVFLRISHHCAYDRATGVRKCMLLFVCADLCSVRHP